MIISDVKFCRMINATPTVEFKKGSAVVWCYNSLGTFRIRDMIIGLGLLSKRMIERRHKLSKAVNLHISKFCVVGYNQDVMVAAARKYLSSKVDYTVI